MYIYIYIYCDWIAGPHFYLQKLHLQSPLCLPARPRASFPPHCGPCAAVPELWPRRYPPTASPGLPRAKMPFGKGTVQAGVTQDARSDVSKVASA